MFSVFWKKVFSLIRLPLEWKSLVIRAYKAHWTVLHSHSYPMNVAAQNITQGQMLPYCSWYLELNLRVFCCSLSHWMGFFWKCHSLGSVSVTCLQIDVSAALGSCSGHVWKCLAVVGIAEWALEVFEPALLDFCFKGRFILYGVRHWPVWSISWFSCLEQIWPKKIPTNNCRTRQAFTVSY